MFTGSGTAIITPFDGDGNIDERGLRDLVDFQESGGVDAIVPCGTTGESATLSHDEHLKVIEIVLDQVSDATVIGGAGSNATHEAIELSKGAEDLGVDYILSISPYYNRPTQSGIVEHYRAIAKSVDTPIIVYNVPSRTGSNIEPPTVWELSKIPGIVGIKEASGSISQVANILRGVPDDFSVLSGDDSITFPLMALGGRGVISVAANLVPSMVRDMVHSMLSGDIERARDLHFKLLPLFDHLFLETNPIPVKTSLGLMGKPAGTFRLPMNEMSSQNLEVLKKTLTSLDLI